MNGILIAFEVVLLLPLFVATWRISLLGLSAQGLLMAWIAFRSGFHLSADSLLELVDLVVLRGLVGPLFLHRVLRRQNAPARHDVIAPNLLSWVIALSLVLMAFRASTALIAEEGEAQTLVAVAASAVLLGLLVLAARTGPFSQMVGVLRLENGIALFELGDDAHHESFGLRLGLVAVFFASLLLLRWYLAHLGSDTDARIAPEEAAL